jgi:hypothetical protein
MAATIVFFATRQKNPSLFSWWLQYLYMLRMLLITYHGDMDMLRAV